MVVASSLDAGEWLKTLAQVTGETEAAITAALILTAEASDVIEAIAAARQLMRTRVCEACGTTFPVMDERQRFCGERCQANTYYRLKRSPRKQEYQKQYDHN